MLDNFSYSCTIEIRPRRRHTKISQRTCTKFQSLHLNFQRGVMGATWAIFEYFTYCHNQTCGMLILACTAFQVLCTQVICKLWSPSRALNLRVSSCCLLPPRYWGIAVRVFDSWITYCILGIIRWSRLRLAKQEMVSFGLEQKKVDDDYWWNSDWWLQMTMTKNELLAHNNDEKPRFHTWSSEVDWIHCKMSYLVLSYLVWLSRFPSDKI